MNAVTLVDFHDNAKNIDRKRGEVFVVSRERFDEINAVGVEKIGVPLVGEVKREEMAQHGKETPESRASKAPSKRRSRKAAE